MKKNFCQSCGMPMSQDPAGGGTNSDGSQNEQYCSYCYQNGEFTSAHIQTAQEMQVFCMKIMQEKGMSKFMSWLFTRGIPKLERWQKTEKEA